MKRIIVCGIGTEVGKTIVSAILATVFEADYWKPVQCGEETDSEKIQSWINSAQAYIHPSIYTFASPLSPHHAAAIEGISIDLNAIQMPQNGRPLIIEGVGGVFVPLTSSQLTIDLMGTWDADWIIVSRHYLGSINHTLLTIEALKERNIKIAGIIFNGEAQKESEEAIVSISRIPVLARLAPEPDINSQTIKRYATQWKPLLSGILLPK